MCALKLFLTCASAGKVGLQQAQTPKQVAAPTSPALAPNSAPAVAPGHLLQQAKAAVLRMLSTACEDVAGLAVIR
jgi:hypothetical protein